MQQARPRPVGMEFQFIPDPELDLMIRDPELEHSNVVATCRKTSVQLLLRILV